MAGGARRKAPAIRRNCCVTRHAAATSAWRRGVGGYVRESARIVGTTEIRRLPRGGFPTGRPPHPRRALRGSAGLPVRAALRRAGRPAHALPRRGRGRRRCCSCTASRRGAPLPQDDPAARGAGARASRRTLRLRPLRQADRPRLHLRPPRRVDGAACRGARPARRHARRAGLGRPDRASPRGRAPRALRPARRHQHGHRRAGAPNDEWLRFRRSCARRSRHRRRPARRRLRSRSRRATT